MNTTPNQAYEYHVGGSLPVNAPSYVKRQADDDLYQALKSGDFCYVLNSRQMGKSSLRVQTMQRLQAEDIRCAAIDLTGIGSSQKVTPDQWYAGIIRSLVSSFELSEKFNLGSWWREQDHLSSVNRFSQFIEQVLLKEVSQHIVIFIDEINSVRLLNFSTDDFFALIRFFYNQRADKPQYERITFTLLGVATPSDLIQDKKCTPFNIGRAIEINGFELDEAEPLAIGLDGKVSNPKEVLQEVLKWTGGQPFLTQKVCQLILADDRGLSVEEIVRSRIIENWEWQDDPQHLRAIRDLLLRNEQSAGGLLGLYKQILQQKGIAADDSPEHKELPLTGLVVKRQGKLEVYNRIYQEVFSQRWVNKELADLRPDFYREAITAWLASKCEDKSLLLRGKVLKDAQKWSAERNLSREDNDFLNASRELYNQELEKVVGPTNLKFKHEEASSAFDLIDLCDRYPDIAEDYLFNEYFETWLFQRSQTDLANLSRKIVSSYQQKQRKGLEMFVRGLCKHLGRDPYPKIYFEPNELDLGKISVGVHKKLSLKIVNKGRGLAWGNVTLDGNLPGVKVQSEFDSSNETFDIELDTLEVEPGNYYGSIDIFLEKIRERCRIYIKYTVIALQVYIEPPKLDLGVVTHDRCTIPASFKVTCEPSDAKVKGISFTEQTYLKVTPSSFNNSSLEFSLTIDTTFLEAGLYKDKIDLRINNSEFQVPVYFRKPLKWDIIAGLTVGIGISTGGFCMYFIRLILEQRLSVGLDDSWVLSYPPEVNRVSFFPLINPLSILDIPEDELTYSILGLIIGYIIILIIWLAFRYELNSFKEKGRLKLETIFTDINELKQKFIDDYTSNNQSEYSYQTYYPRNKIITFLCFLFKILLFILMFLLLIAFIINCLVNIFALLGSSFILIPELTVYSLTAIGVKQPAVGWLILGCLVGGTFGLIQALKRIKQYSFLSKVYKIAVVTALILFLIGSLTAKFQPPTEFFSKIVLEEDFQAASNWKIAPSAKIKNGGLFHQETKKRKASTSVWGDKNNAIANFDFSADVKKVSGPDDLQFGLIARYNHQNQSRSGDNFYYLQITGNGEFAMGKLSASKKSEDKVGWQKSTAINQGNNLNRLRIVCYKQKVIGWINNQRVGMFEDDSFTSGQIGVISAPSDGDAVAVYFDNVIVKTKPE